MSKNKSYQTTYPGLGRKNIWVTGDFPAKTLTIEEMETSHIWHTYNELGKFSSNEQVWEKMKELEHVLRLRGEIEND